METSCISGRGRHVRSLLLILHCILFGLRGPLGIAALGSLYHFDIDRNQEILGAGIELHKNLKILNCRLLPYSVKLK